MSAPKRVLIVGGTSGIGRGLAEYYAAKGANVTIMGRNEEAAREIAAAHPGVTFTKVEGTLLRDIVRVTDEFKRNNPRLDALILCQGILTFKSKQTNEGLDDGLALIYYGRMLFIRELLPIMPPGSRVLTVLNAERGNHDKVHWDDLDLKKSFSVFAAINHVFAFNDIMMPYFAEHNPTVHFTHVFPGWVETNIARNLPWYVRMLFWPSAKLKNIKPIQCAPLMERAMDDTAGWRLADQKGGTITKPPISKERIELLSEHTWKAVDAALQDK